MKNVVIMTVCIALLFAAMYLVPVRELTIDLVATVKGFGSASLIVFLVLYVAFALVGFSRTLLHFLAGVIFEPLIAIVVVIFASLSAFACTFGISRYLAEDWVANRLKEFPIAKTLMSSVNDYGFRLLILMRMNPFVPGFINGYGFGLTSIKFLPYMVASAIGALPMSFLQVYLGWAGGEAMLQGEQPQSLQTATLWVGVSLSLVLLAVIGWYGHRAMRKASQEADESVAYEPANK